MQYQLSDTKMEMWQPVLAQLQTLYKSQQAMLAYTPTQDFLWSSAFSRSDAAALLAAATRDQSRFINVFGTVYALVQKSHQDISIYVRNSDDASDAPMMLYVLTTSKLVFVIAGVKDKQLPAKMLPNHRLSWIKQGW